MESLKEYLDNLFKNEAIAPSTLKSRIAFLLSIAKTIPGKHTDLSFLSKQKAVMARVLDSENHGTRFNRLVFIIAAIDSLSENILTKRTNDYYRSQLTKYEKLKQIRKDDNRMNQKQIDNFTELDNLQLSLATKFNELFERYGITNRKVSRADMDRLSKIGRNGYNLWRLGKDYQELMILACYIFQPSLRDNFGHMKFASSVAKTKDTSKNYFRYARNWKDATIHMSVYKNVKVLGTNVQIKCFKALLEVMKNWFDFLTLMLGEMPDYVFLYDFNISEKKTSWIDSKKELAQRVKRASLAVFEKDLTINSYRHIWEQYIHDHPDYKSNTIAESEDIHNMLMHNYDTANRYVLIKDHPNGPKK